MMHSSMNHATAGQQLLASNCP